MEKTQAKKGQTSLLIAIGIVILLFACCSCSIQKDATKTKSDTETKTDLETSTNTQSEISSSNRSYIIEPINNLKPFYYTSKGGKNAKITYITNNTTQKEVKQEDKKDNSVIKSVVKEKASSKIEKSDTTIFLYIVIGFTLVMLLAVYLAYRAIDKRLSLL